MNDFAVQPFPSVSPGQAEDLRLDSFTGPLLRPVTDPLPYYVLPESLRVVHNRISRHFGEGGLVSALGFSGLFLSGVRGCGKSLYPEFLASGLRDRAELIHLNPVVLERPSDLSRALHSLEQSAPSVRIVRIDEADILFKDAARDRYVAELSQFMDNPLNRNVFVIATMNDDFELLPQQLRRAGRFVCLEMEKWQFDLSSGYYAKTPLGPPRQPADLESSTEAGRVHYVPFGCDPFKLVDVVDRALSVLEAAEGRFFDGSKRDLIAGVREQCHRFYSFPHSAYNQGWRYATELVRFMGLKRRSDYIDVIKNVGIFRESTPADLAKRYKLLRPELSDPSAAKKVVGRILFLATEDCMKSGFD